MQIQEFDITKAPSLPNGTVVGKGEFSGVLGFDSAARVIRVLLEFPIPTDEQIQHRKGKKTDKNPDGDKVITSHVYGKAKAGLPLQDGDGNQLKLTGAKLM